jgi:hypothetical protein
MVTIDMNSTFLFGFILKKTKKFKIFPLFVFGQMAKIRHQKKSLANSSQKIMG